MKMIDHQNINKVAIKDHITQYLVEFNFKALSVIKAIFI